MRNCDSRSGLNPVVSANRGRLLFLLVTFLIDTTADMRDILAPPPGTAEAMFTLTDEHSSSVH